MTKEIDEIVARPSHLSVYRGTEFIAEGDTNEVIDQAIRAHALAEGSGRYSVLARTIVDVLVRDVPEPPIDPEPPSPPEPPTDPSEISDFRGFAEIPEISFVVGYEDTEQLRIWMLDTANRVWPGDWKNESEWHSQQPVSLQVVDSDGGLPQSLFNFDAGTMELRYLGAGSSHTGKLSCRLVCNGVQSNTFNIRVLKPTAVWGKSAGTYFLGVPSFDEADWSFAAFRKELSKGKSYDEPEVIFITPGHYSGEDWYLGSKHYLYLFGCPNDWPTLEDDVISSSNYRVRYAKYLHLVSCGHQGTSLLDNLKDGDNSDDYITKVTFRDEKKWGTAISTPSYEDNHGAGPDRDMFPIESRFRTFAWNMHSTQMGSTDGTQHMFYVQSRPNTQLHINNIRVDGTRRCDCVKSTRSQVFIRNSYLSAVQDENNLEKGYRAAVCIDIPACTPIGGHVIYNNELVGAGSEARGGIKPAMLYLRSRRDWYASDDPHYPDKNFDSGEAWHPPYNRPASLFVDPSFWAGVMSIPRDAHEHPETFKHFVAFNKFRWIDEGGEYQQTSAYRNEGTYPRKVTSQFRAGSVFMRVPPQWVERSVGFFYFNSFEGFGSRDRLVIDESEVVEDIEPGAKWPRDPADPTMFPAIVHAEHYALGKLPEWFPV